MSKKGPRVTPMAWVWITLLAAAAVSAALVWSHGRHARFASTFTQQQTLLRHARVDLANGYVHVALAGRLGGPFDRAQGLALLGQAVSSLRQATRVQEEFEAKMPLAGGLGSHAEQMARLATAVETFRSALSTHRPGPESSPAQDASMRIAFLALEQQAGAAEAAIDRGLDAGMRQHVRTDTTILVVSGLLLAIIGLAALAGGRSQKRVTAELRESEALFRDLFERHAAAKLLIDPETGRIVDANQAAAKFYGWPRERLVRMNIQDINTLSPDDVAREMEKARSLERVHFEFRHLRADGSIRDVDVFSSSVAVKGKRLIHSIIHDATERRHAETALVQSQAMLKGITDTIPEPIFLKDREGRWTFANPATLQVAGKSLEEVIGKTDREIYPDAQVGDALAATDQRIMESGVPEVVEETIQTPEGYRVYLSTKAPFRAPDGRVVGLVGGARDITDRKHAEDALRERDYLLSESQRIAHIGTWTSEVGTDAIRWSEEAYRIFGVPPETCLVTPASFLAFVHPEDRSSMQEWVRAGWSGLNPVERDFRIVRPDGNVRVVQGRGELIRRPDGTPLKLNGTVQDVTELRRAADALRDSERRLRFAMEGANDGIWDVNMLTGQVFLSPRGCEMFGYAFDEFDATVTSWNQMVHPEDLSRTQASLEDHLAGRTPLFEIEQRLRTRSGEYRWTLARGKVSQRDASGLAVRMTGTHTDITQRKQAEEALRLSLERFQLAIRATFNVIWDWDLETDTLAWNENITLVFGHPAHEIEPGIESWTRRIHPEDLARVETRIHAAIGAGGDTWSDEYRFRRGDGTFATVVDRGIISRDPGGTPVRMIGAMEDITDRKLAEADRERLTTAIEQAAEEVLITDAQGTIVYVNPAFEAVTGYSRAEAVGQNPRFLKSGKHDDSFYRDLWDTIGSGKVWRGRLTNRKKDGALYTEEATISPVRNDGGIVTSFVAVKRDITRDLALEAQLLQSQKMEGIGRLAGGVAHDFNNILSVILSCSSFALEEAREGDPIREDLLEIEKAGKRAASLTRQLLAFSRKQVLQPVALDINAVLAEIERMLQRIIGEDVDLVLALQPGLGPVRADPGQVEQVIMNLAINARDAMPEGGKLTIETAECDLDEEYVARHPGSAPGPHVMIAVSDSGVGMNAATIPRVFEPFFTTKGPGKGSGLGLSTVYGIVKQSGGSIYVYSEVGQGTTFKVYLPRETGPADPVTIEVREALRTKCTETVLVVEDDDSVRAIATRMLTDAGYEVLPASNGAEGLVVADQHLGEIDLVLTDVVMPGMSGRVFRDRLVTARPGAKVLYMSVYTDNAIVHHGTLDPGTHFIAKPFTRDELLRRVRAVIDGTG